VQITAVDIYMAVVSYQALYNHNDISDSSPNSPCHHPTAFQQHHITINWSYYMQQWGNE